MTEKQLFYPLLSVYFSLILGDLQKEKLQIVSIFRFGHKKRGTFSVPSQGEGVLSVCVLANYKGLPPLGEGWGGALRGPGRGFWRVGFGHLPLLSYLVKLNLMLNPKSLVVVGKLLFANSGVFVCRS